MAGQNPAKIKMAELMLRVLSQKLDGFEKRVEAGGESGRLGGHSKQSVDEANLGEKVTLVRAFRLSFPDHIHRLVAT